MSNHIITIITSLTILIELKLKNYFFFSLKLLRHSAV